MDSTATGKHDLDGVPGGSRLLSQRLQGDGNLSRLLEVIESVFSVCGYSLSRIRLIHL